jgi:hypothetical protein
MDFEPSPVDRGWSADLAADDEGLSRGRDGEGDKGQRDEDAAKHVPSLGGSSSSILTRKTRKARVGKVGKAGRRPWKSSSPIGSGYFFLADFFAPFLAGVGLEAGLEAGFFDAVTAGAALGEFFLTVFFAPFLEVAGLVDSSFALLVFFPKIRSKLGTP